MFLVMFLILFLIFLVIICITNFFLSSAIKLVTNNTLEEYKFIVPSILFLIITCMTFLLIYLLNISMLNLSIMDSIMALVFKTVDIVPKLRNILILDILIIIISIIIQSICLLTVNIDYTVTFGKIRIIFKDFIKNIKLKINNKAKKFSKEKKNTNGNKLETQISENNNIVDESTQNSKLNLDTTNNEISNLAAVIPEGEMAENKEKLKLSIPNAIICTTFIFSFQFFMFMILFTIGATIANKIL